ncbi:hypothetical protein F7Q99_33115 [Streptomyces kaniharaensis]|uniref:Tetratricopeptide repeat protein n=1 Tax=Streptomyces kaniharaensis TaxID=212423 RepID=A0A6N7KZC7_9ACTN|nr:hypothetical protein [Streptomyces kaniharaensis]MQS16900.1 hypothetical protein [Streptomyces kaniharaensis]
MPCTEVVAAIEQALRENPDDLASWLRHADRLLTQGDARGELIRLEQLRARTRPADREALAAEIGATEDEHRHAWNAESPVYVPSFNSGSRGGERCSAATHWWVEKPELGEQLAEAFEEYEDYFDADEGDVVEDDVADDDEDD